MREGSHTRGAMLYIVHFRRAKQRSLNQTHDDVSFSQYITPTQWVINSEKEYDFAKVFFINTILLLSFQIKKLKKLKEQSWPIIIW